MRPPPPIVLGVFYAGSEMLLWLTRRSKSADKSRDRYSLRILWIVITIAATGSIVAVNYVRSASLPYSWLSWVGLALFVIGLVVRWYAIVHLGRFFTVDVSIAAGHTVIDSGPYRFVRHPSYSGSLLAFLGFGLCLHNWIALLVLMLPITAAFLWRIWAEEHALHEGLGDDYRRYASQVKRLVPFVY